MHSSYRTPTSGSEIVLAPASRYSSSGSFFSTKASSGPQCCV